MVSTSLGDGVTKCEIRMHACKISYYYRKHTKIGTSVSGSRSLLGVGLGMLLGMGIPQSLVTDHPSEGESEGEGREIP